MCSPLEGCEDIVLSVHRLKFLQLLVLVDSFLNQDCDLINWLCLNRAMLYVNHKNGAEPASWE